MKSGDKVWMTIEEYKAQPFKYDGNCNPVPISEIWPDIPRGNRTHNTNKKREKAISEMKEALSPEEFQELYTQKPK